MPAELPSPSAELVLFRVSMESLIEILGRKKSERFLRAISDRLLLEESFADVASIRPTKDEAAVARARREAIAIWRQQLPRLIGRL